MKRMKYENLIQGKTVKRVNFIMVLVLMVSIGIVVTSCTSFQVSGIEIAPHASVGDIIGDFDITVRLSKFLGNSAGTNLFNVTSGVTDPLVDNAVKAEIIRMGGSKAINVKMEHRAGFWNMFWNSVTMSIYAPSRVRVTGTVIR